MGGTLKARTEPDEQINCIHVKTFLFNFLFMSRFYTFNDFLFCPFFCEKLSKYHADFENYNKKHF